MCQVGTVDTMGNNRQDPCSLSGFFTVLNYPKYGRPQDNKHGYSKIQTDDLIVKMWRAKVRSG